MERFLYKALLISEPPLGTKLTEIYHGSRWLQIASDVITVGGFFCQV